MSKERTRFLVREYRETEEKLDELRKKYITTEARFEIFNDLEKELITELERAKERNDASLIKYWQEIIDKYLSRDKDRPDKKDLEKAQNTISGENEKLIMYYEKKIKMIRRILGARLVQILDGYDEKNMLMGTEYSSGKVLHQLDEEDEKERKISEEKKKGYTFDRM
jgi:hypothetical protein